MDLKDQIDSSNLPRHIAIIMDGNGRWAKKHNKSRIFGHKNGIDSVRNIVESCAELGIEFLTLYAFSTENWDRPKKEINALMELLVFAIKNETKKLNENDIRLLAIGNIEDLPKRCQTQLYQTIESTKNNKRMTLVLALSYSSRWEIGNAIKNIARDVASDILNPEEINESTINGYLETRDIPDPELLIRTSGENRVSNFLLWQIAYTELYFTSALWPDFNKDELLKAILDYQGRERRFGKTSEQIILE